jgi:hypothetical protein
VKANNQWRKRKKKPGRKSNNERHNSMKKINISNRIGLSLNAALLALLVGSLALGHATSNHGRIIHSASKPAPSHFAGYNGLRCDSWSWLRRFPWLY